MDQEPNGAGVCAQSEMQSSNIFSRQHCRRSISRYSHPEILPDTDDQSSVL